MGRTMVAAVLATTLLTACGGADDRVRENGLEAAPTPEGGATSEPVEGRAISGWLSTDQSTAASCVYSYPDDLSDRPIAFDGTIVGVTRDAYDEDAGAAPVDLKLRVNHVFAGDITDTVRMHTWDFSLPGDDVTGVRVLAAAEESMDLMGCGFTRPYSADEAALWEETFGG